MVKTNHELSQIHKRSKLHAMFDDLIKVKRFCAFFMDMWFCNAVFYTFFSAYYVYFYAYLPGSLYFSMGMAFEEMLAQNSILLFSAFVLFNYGYQVVCSLVFKKTFAFYVLGLNFESKSNNLLGHLLRPIGLISFIPINGLLLFNLKSTKYLQDMICEIDIINNLKVYGDFINAPDESAFQASIDISSLKEYEELLEEHSQNQEAA